MKMRLISRIVAALAVALGSTGGAAAQTVVNANITANTTWTLAGSPYILEGAIFVKNGAILTILPGVVVRGQPRIGPAGGAAAGGPGALIITQNGRLIANASATNPIIFTTAAIDNNGDNQADDDDADTFKDRWAPGDVFLDDSPKTAPLAPLAKGPTVGAEHNVQLWGGLVILGNAPTNLAGQCSVAGTNVGYGKCTVEGLTVPGVPTEDAAYGGSSPHDSSGSLRYLSIRHGGDQLGADNELNGVTLAAVGDGTVFEYIEVYGNWDDGIEWFGGTVGGNHLVASFIGDDMFDMDQGYTGVNQYLFGIMPFFNQNDGGSFGFGSGDKACEFDGDDFRPDAPASPDNVNLRRGVLPGDTDGSQWPKAAHTIFNMTLIGSYPDAGQSFVPASGPPSGNLGCQWRNGASGEVHNSIIVNTGTSAGQSGIVITPTTNPANEVAGHGVVANVTAGLTSLVCSTLDDGAAPGANENAAIANGDSLAVQLGGTLPDAANSINPNPSPNLLVNEDTTFNPTGNASGKLDTSLKPVKINPRPRVTFPALPIGGCPAPAGRGLDPAAPIYRGAFDPSGAVKLWTNTWTALSQGGLM
jgi:hypothetical protein